MAALEDDDGLPLDSIDRRIVAVLERHGIAEKVGDRLKLTEVPRPIMS